MRLIAVMAMLGVALTPASAIAAERPALDGFQNFRFGMNESEIRQISEVKEIRAARHDQYQMLETLQPITIDGTAYNVQFILQKPKVALSTIRLSEKRGATLTECAGDFDRAFGLVQAKYGRPDRVPI